ncbi:odorant receptor 4 [Diachasma alloeum]|uniref:Odorant receptor n=1 Tax=Diachasma alloeum TaxID=454923 RepID=A0A4E0S1C7_9HYME|nr:odorant receptor 4 [Diachasma alloeum]THK33250.1 odorant receptor 20 [Diachasma alloeum]
MRIDFEYTCGWNRVLMDFAGFWPKPRSSFIGKNWPLIHAVIVLIVIIIPRFAAMFLFWNEVDAVVQSFATQLIFIVVFFKLIVLQFGNKVLVDLLVTMEDDLSTELTEEQYTPVFKAAKIARTISMFLGIATISILSTGIVSLKLYHLDSFYIKNPDPRLSTNFFFVAYLPFNTTSIITYMMILSIQFYISVISTGIHLILDSFIMMLVLHICGQLQVVQESLTQLVKGILGFEKLSFQVAFRAVLMKHQAVCRFTKNLDALFNFIWFLELFSCTLTLCFQGYTVQKLLHSDQSTIFQMGFPLCSTLGLVSQFFLNCWAGEYLMSESAEIGFAYYRSEWYTLVSSDARSLMMIGHQGLRPLTLTTCKFSILSLRLFLQVMKASFSYLSMLLVLTHS